MLEKEKYGLSDASFGKRVIKIIFCLSVISIAIIYFFYDPSQTQWMPRCILYSSTGLYCPGCGTQRALHALLHLHFREALHFNAFFVISLFYIGILLAARNKLFGFRYSERIMSILNRSIVVKVFLCMTIAWTLIRNLVSI